MLRFHLNKLNILRSQTLKFFNFILCHIFSMITQKFPQFSLFTLQTLLYFHHAKNFDQKRFKREKKITKEKKIKKN